MPSNEEARLEYLRHEREEWEKFFESKRWRQITARGQELANVLQNKLINMEVKDISGVIELLDVRARLKGVIANSLVPVEIAAEIDDEINRLKERDDGR